MYLLPRSFDEIQTRLRNGEQSTCEDLRWLAKNATDGELQLLARIISGRQNHCNQAIYEFSIELTLDSSLLSSQTKSSDECAVRLEDRAALPTVLSQIEELKSAGGAIVRFKRSRYKSARFGSFANIVANLSERCGSVFEICPMSVEELIDAAKVNKMTVKECASILKRSGAHSISGPGLEIEEAARRDYDPPLHFIVKKCFPAQAEILSCGLKTDATMIFGCGETFEERLDYLEGLRVFQDSLCGALTTFICYQFNEAENSSAQKSLEQEFLRHIALCRIYLDNFRRVKASPLIIDCSAADAMNYGANYFDIAWPENPRAHKSGAPIGRHHL